MPKKVQLPVRMNSSTNRVAPYQTKKISSRSPGTSLAVRRLASHSSVAAPIRPDTDSYRNNGWKCVVASGKSSHGYAATRWAQSIAIPHGNVVGGPYSSWLKKFPNRPTACMMKRAGATMSAQVQKLTL